jgi:hypothetical protein
MAGGYFVTGFGSTYVGGHRHPTLFSPDDPQNAPWEKQVGSLKQFFTTIEWWKLAPHDELLSCDTPRGKDRWLNLNSRTGQRGVERAPAVAWRCLAEQYVVCGRGLTRPVSLRLDHDKAALKAIQFDPRTGERKEQGKATRAKHFDYQPPDAEHWLVVLQ